MNKYDVANYLNQGHEITKEINALKERRARLWQEISNAVPAYESDGSQLSRDNQSKEKKLAAHADLMELIDDKIEELSKLDQHIFKIIYQLEVSEYRNILMFRYVDRMHWKDICKKMHISARTSHRLHDKALKAVTPYVEQMHEVKV